MRPISRSNICKKSDLCLPAAMPLHKFPGPVFHQKTSAIILFDSISICFHRLNMDSMPSVLLQYINEKKKKNSRYSLRSLAKGIEISPSQLSSIINKRKKLSPKQAIKIIQKLNLTEQESLELLSDIHPELKNALNRKMELRQLSSDEFALISNWIHFAILSLSYFKDNKASCSWIANQLGVSEVEIEPAFRRLEKLGLVEIRGLKFCQTSKPLTTTTDVPSEAIRSHHRQNLQKALIVLDKVPVWEREFSSITLPIDFKDMQKAKDMINDFKKKLYRELKCDDPTDVYTLSLQFFPLTNPEAK
ncbi:MAG: TIGR02147 family protein [Bdellovibrionaceae bacterium]|nr:TIGR02147 family protein [Pseudobdellovibrionaceae bacterium]